LTLAALVIGRIFGEDLKGSKWIYATNNQTFSRTTLTLRNNETFRVDISGADVGCYFSGRYQKQGDTILLDKNVIEKTHSTLATKYFLIDSLLIPVVDTSIKNNKVDTLYIADRLSGVQHSHLCKPGRHANNELWCMFQQQFRAEGTLLSDNSNNGLLIINLATVTGRREF